MVVLFLFLEAKSKNKNFPVLVKYITPCRHVDYRECTVWNPH
jgi:hypothetical protein